MAVALCAFASGCADLPSTDGDVSVADARVAPTKTLALSDVKVEPNAVNVLACTISFTTEAPTESWVDLGIGSQRSVRVRAKVSGTEHRILVIGMRPESTYTLDVYAESLDHTARGTERLQFATGAVPASVPRPKVSRTVPADAGHEWSMISPLVIGQTTLMAGTLVMYDSEGIPVWYTAEVIPGMFMEYADDGHEVVVASPWPYAVGLDGSITWVEPAFRPQGTSFGPTPNVVTDDVHHDVHTLPNGNLSMMRYDVRGDRIGDKLQEVTRTGQVVWEWKALDHIEIPGAGDIFHGNAFSFSADHSSAIYSAGILDAVFKIDVATGEILWRLGQGGTFTLKGKAEDWFHHQHSPYELPNGHILMFDNGNSLVDEQNKPRGSRAAEYALDLVTQEAELVWKYPPDGSSDFFVSDLIGGAQRLPSGNTVITTTFGKLTAAFIDGARVFEVTPEGQRLWAYDFDPPYALYRTNKGLPGGVELINEVAD